MSRIAKVANCPLGIITPTIGSPSETFIRRHVTDLLPGRTAVIAESYVEENRIAWRFDGPLFLTDQGSGSVRASVARRLAKLGFVPGQWTSFFLERGVKTVMTEYFGFAAEIGRALQKHGIRWYVHGHGHDLSKAIAHGRGQKKISACSRADGIIVVANHQRDRLASRGIDIDRIHVVPCGTTPPAKTKRNFSHRPLRFISVGRLVEKKAPLKTLEAFRIASLDNPDLHLDLVGGGALLDQARGYVEAHGLGDRVIIHGPQPAETVHELLKESHVFLLHSVTAASGDEEGLPVSILEAMANGMPVVSTFHAGIPDAVIDEQTGYLVGEGDVTGMAEAMGRIAKNPGLAELMGNAGRQRFFDRFTFERERADLLRIMRLEEHSI